MMSKAPRVSVAIVEDHVATRAALVADLAEHAERVEIVTAVGDAPAFFASLKLQSIQVALVDLGLPGVDGHALIRRLGEAAPDVRALALTAFDDDQSVLQAVQSGAHGYLLKDEPTERIVRAIEEAATGAHPISSRVAGYLLTHARRSPPPVALSDREEELAVALAQGLTYAECSARMGIAVGTVQDYVKRVYRKLDINSKREVRDWVTRYLSAR